MTAAEQLKTATISKPTDRTIRIEREFDAPRDLVFATFVNPDLVPSGGARGARPPRSSRWTSAPAATIA